jgi:hypothetical protein
MASLKILYGALNRGVSVVGVIFKVYGELKEKKKKCIYYVIKDKVILLPGPVRSSRRINSAA